MGEASRNMKLFLICAILATYVLALPAPSPDDVVPEIMQHEPEFVQHDPCEPVCADKTPDVVKHAAAKCESKCKGTRSLVHCMTKKGRSVKRGACKRCAKCIARKQETRMSLKAMLKGLRTMLCPKNFKPDPKNPCDKISNCIKRAKCTINADHHRCTKCHEKEDNKPHDPCEHECKKPNSGKCKHCRKGHESHSAPSHHYSSYSPATHHSSYSPATHYSSYSPATHYSSYSPATHHYSSYSPATYHYSSYSPATHHYSSYSPATHYSSYSPATHHYPSYSPATHHYSSY